jgi:hypothetical protein
MYIENEQNYHLLISNKFYISYVEIELEALRSVYSPKFDEESKKNIRKFL